MRRRRRPSEPVDFQTLFLAQDEEDEDDNALVEALIALRTWAAAQKKAADKTGCWFGRGGNRAAAARQKALLLRFGRGGNQVRPSGLTGGGGQVLGRRSDAHINDT